MTLRSHAIRLPGRVDLRYAESGSRDGLPVVLLHAYADSWRSFASVLEWLPPWIRAIAPSQRGHGDSGKPASGYAVDDFTHDLASFVDMLDLDRPVLVASSSAGFSALQFAALQPDRVRGLVLLGVPWRLADRAPALGFLEVVAALTDPVDPVLVREFVEGTSSSRVPRAFLDEMVCESRKVPAHVWRQALAGLLSASPPSLGAVTAPTLIVWGDRDELIPRSDQERLLVAIPGSRLLVYEGVGHVVHWEEPERVARDIDTFAAGLSI